jgi:NADPH:quinone reductase-like Zn-dependent oxidoreductase
MQLLRLSGFSKIIAIAAKKHEPLLTKYGATHIIDRSLPADVQVEEIRSIAPHLQYAWDPVASKDTSELAARSFGPQGGLIVASLPIDPTVIAAHKNVSAKHIISNPADHQPSATILWTNLDEALKKGDILPLPYRIGGGLAQTADALKAVKTASGYKVIVHPQE